MNPSHHWNTHTWSQEALRAANNRARMAMRDAYFHNHGKEETCPGFSEPTSNLTCSVVSHNANQEERVPRVIKNERQRQYHEHMQELRNRLNDARDTE